MTPLPDGLLWLLGTATVLLALLRERRPTQTKPSPEHGFSPTGHSVRKDQT